jgi:DNA-binding NarL/FixJ family response regulator
MRAGTTDSDTNGDSRSGGASSLIRILLVDDDVMTLATLKSVFGTHDDVVVEVAMSAAESLKKLAQVAIHAIVADFNLVGPNGGLILRRVREDYPDVRRVLLSGSSYAELSPKLERGLADVFLSKPIDLDSIEELVDSLRS